MKIKRIPIEVYRWIWVMKRRLRLKNPDFKLIANNRCGGIIYHDLGLQFLSPTVNLFMQIEDYFNFLENLKECLETPIIQENSGGAYPVGKKILVPENV